MMTRSYLGVTNIIVAATFGISLAGFPGFSVRAFEPRMYDQAKARTDGEDNNDGNQKVSVELYYESQCPGCREMITTSFYDAFKTEGFLDMAEVVLVPYGNARENKTASGSYEFQCQHGPSECIYNTIEACALAKIDDPLVAFQYIDCIERSDESRDPEQDYYKVAITCCKLTKLPDDVVSKMQECAMGLEGIQLEHEAAVKTDALDPPHKYVPYVVANGEHSDDIQDAITDSLFNYVCQAYQGPDKSSACPGSSNGLRASRIVGGKFPHEERELCYRGDEPEATVAEA